MTIEAVTAKRTTDQSLLYWRDVQYVGIELQTNEGPVIVRVEDEQRQRALDWGCRVDAPDHRTVAEMVGQQVHGIRLAAEQTAQQLAVELDTSVGLMIITAWTIHDDYMPGAVRALVDVQWPGFRLTDMI